MKNKLFIFAMALFMVMPIFAFASSQGPELGEPAELIAWLSPVIVWAAGWVVSLSKVVPGWVMLTIVVPVLSFLYTLVTSEVDMGESSFWLQFVFGLAAVFIDQTKKKIQEKIPNQ